MFRLAICVFIGSGIGGTCRFLISRAINALMPQCVFPWATFAVNMLGCFIIGVIYGYIGNGHTLSPQTQAILAAGFCGGLTTFSTFSHENMLLFQSGHFHTFILYALLSLIFGFIAAALGHAAVR